MRKRMYLMMVCVLALIFVVSCGKGDKKIQNDKNLSEEIITDDVKEELHNEESIEKKTKESTVNETNTTNVITEKDNQASNQQEISGTIVLVDLSKKQTSHPSNAVFRENLVTITSAGTYQIYGTLSNGSLIIDAKKDSEISITLENVNISNSSFAPIYIKKAKTVTITLADHTQNILTNSGKYVLIDDNNVDAVLFSKSDVVIEGNGKLNITSKFGNGITGKDNICIKSGEISINVTGHALEANDSIMINGGTLSLCAGKDSIHCENDEDTTLGIFTMNGGNVTIRAVDDAIHSVATLTINNGTLNVEECFEGFESAKIFVSGGTICMNATDDGINATVGAEIDCYNGEALIHISGGKMEIVTMGDAFDSNGDILMTGGEVLCHGPGNTKFGFGTLDYVNKAEITGGKIIAFTSRGKSFCETSSQASFNLNLSALTTAGTKVTVTDSNGNIILSEVAKTSFNCIIVSTPKIVVGNQYSINVGERIMQVNQRKIVVKTKE